MSNQHVVKYLGKASNVTINDIPLEYRTSPKILSILASKTKEQYKKSLIIKELKNQVFEYLKNGNIPNILEVVEKYERQTSLSEFYDDILKPVMYEIGYLWQQNKLDIATEHVCSNIANKAIHIINKTHRQQNKKGSILLCTPEGEIHNIACHIIESVLLENGFRVHNISPSVPTDSIITYLSDTSPSLVLISITLSDNMGSAIRLTKKIADFFDIPIILGGIAINNSSEDKKRNIESISPNVKVITSSTLDKLLQTVKVLINNNYKRKIGNY